MNTDSTLVTRRPEASRIPDGCVVLMRAYDGGTEPVWDMGNTVACTLALLQVDLASGESQSLMPAS